MNECCEACGGNGKINGETCKYCKGVGWFEEKPTQENVCRDDCCIVAYDED